MYRLKKVSSIMLSLGIGAVCIMVSYFFLAAIQPALRLALVVDDGKVLLRFSNRGREQIILDSLGMEYFVLYPADDSKKYVVIARTRQPGTMRERAVREAKRAVLQAGDHIDAANVYPLLKNLPPGEARLAAVYTASADTALDGTWQGTVSSLSIPVSIR